MSKFRGNINCEHKFRNSHVLNIRLIILLHFIFASVFYSACSPKPVATPPPDDFGCQPPPPDVFLAANVNVRFVQSTFSDFVTGGVDLGVMPEVISLASQAAIDTRITSYMRCLAIKRDGYSQEQAAYFDHHTAFMATKPTTELYLEWMQTNPFPGNIPGMLSDVIIAEFESDSQARATNISARIERDLRNSLTSYGINDISVAIVPDMSQAKADFLAKQGRNKVVIWGWQDRYDLHLRILLGDRDQEHEQRKLPSMRQINLGLVDKTEEELQFLVRKGIPQNTTFLSLFVIGHLKYLSNNYLEGKRVFDAAMEQLPEGISLENQGLIHFFKARQLNLGNPEDLSPIVCEYTKAIKADTSLVAAYNNLASVLVRTIQPLTYQPQFDVPSLRLPGEALNCLVDAQLVNEDVIEINDADNLVTHLETTVAGRIFDRAKKLGNDLAIIRYNSLAFQWNTLSEPGQASYWVKNVSEYGFLRELLQIIKSDSTIPGTHIMLGVIKFESGEYAEASEHFVNAIDLSSSTSHLFVNLGKSYWLQGQRSKAKKAFQEALRINSEDNEAHLALASLASHEENVEEAKTHIETILSSEEENYFINRASILLHALLLANEGMYEEAQLLIQGDEFDHALFIYLRAVLYELMGDPQLAVQSWDQYFSPREHGFPFREDTRDRVWDALMRQCEESNSIDFLHDWSNTKDCLSIPNEQIVHKLLSLTRDQISLRIYFRYFIYPGDLACPFVLTFDTEANLWSIDTTILYKLDQKRKESQQRRVLSRFDGRIKIKELESEISYIDQVYVEGLDSLGTRHLFNGNLASLESVDGIYEVFYPGDEVMLTFENFDKSVHLDTLWVIATGYYTPISGFPHTFVNPTK